MQKFFKKLSPLVFYWHLILDTFVIYIFAIVYLNMGMPTFASLILTIDTLFKIFLSMPLSWLTLKIPPHSLGKLSVIIKTTIVIFFIIIINEVSLNDISALGIIMFLIFKLFILIDSFISYELIFLFKKKFDVNLLQLSAGQNILVRSSTALAPAVALAILSFHYKQFIFLIAISLMMVCTIFFRKIFFSNDYVTLLHRPRNHLPFKKLIQSPLMRLGIIYQIVCNLSFGGVSLLFLAKLNVHGALIFNEVTALYSSFFFAQLIVLFFGEKAVPAKKISHIAGILGTCSLLLMMISFMPPGILRPICCSLMGITYSLALSAVQKIITSSFQGDYFIGYVGWAQTIGRLSSLISTVVLGASISSGASVSLLLDLCATLGSISAVVLLSLTMKLDRP